MTTVVKSPQEITSVLCSERKSINESINWKRKIHLLSITEACCHRFLQFREPVFACLGHFQIIWLAHTCLYLYV